MRSRYGLALTAIRDSQSAAASVGVNAQRLKLGVYVLAAGIAGLVGALIILQKLRITPAAGFSVLDWSANVIFIVVIGGIGTIEGPIIGALVFFTLRFFLADYGTWYLIVLGSVAVAVMLKAPRGIWGYLSDRHDLQLFPVQRRVRIQEEGTEAPTEVGAAHFRDRVTRAAARLTRAGSDAWRALRSRAGNLASFPLRDVARSAPARVKSVGEAVHESIVVACNRMRRRLPVRFRSLVLAARALAAKSRLGAETATQAMIICMRIVCAQACSSLQQALRNVRSAISWRPRFTTKRSRSYDRDDLS